LSAAVLTHRASFASEWPVVIANDHEHIPLVGLYTRPFGTQAWRMHIEFDEPVEANGNHVVLHGEDYPPCFYDILAVFANGRREMLRRVDACEGGYYSLGRGVAVTYEKR
jgi:hypothetical protein